MLKDVFNDCFAQKENYLSAVDARIKILFTAGLIVVCLFSGRHFTPLLVSAVCLFLLLSIGIPLKIITQRLIAALGVAVMVALMQVFLYGATPLLKLRLFGFTLIGYSEGLARGVLILCRVMGAVSSVAFLSMSTPLNKLLAAARCFRVPYTWIEITLLTYRYIFMLFEDALTIRNAQRQRLGYSGIRRSLRSIGELAGASVIRVYDHSRSIQEAMDLRGYREKIIYDLPPTHKGLVLRDYIAAAGFVAILLFLAIINLYMERQQ
jgi:cobalt/nickel transport system permease protein